MLWRKINFQQFTFSQAVLQPGVNSDTSLIDGVVSVSSSSELKGVEVLMSSSVVAGTSSVKDTW